MKINSILEHKKVEIYLQRRGLINQYKKSKKFILNGKYKLVGFKLRKPTSDKIYYFRINKQYRAFCYNEGSVLKVFKISDYQN